MPAKHRSASPVPVLPRRRSFDALILGTLIVSASAAAQQTPPAPVPVPAPEQSQSTSDTPATVTVTTKRNSNRIDRQVYDVKADPASSNDLSLIHI